MRVLLLVPMVPQVDGLGAMPKLLHAQLLGLTQRHEVTVIGSFGELPGQAEAATALVEAGFDAHFIDRRRSNSATRRWRVRLELAARWSGRRWPWRVVSNSGGVQEVLDRLAGSRRFDVVSVEDNSFSVLRLPRGVAVVLTEHEARRARPGPGGPGFLRGAGARLQELDWRRWEHFQPRTWRGADLLQVYSGRDAKCIGERAPEITPRVRVNPFGIALPPAADMRLETAGMLLFTGTFTHPPNRDAARWLAAEIMPAIRAANPLARLRIVGTAPPPDVLALAGNGVEIVADAPSMESHLEAASVILAPLRSGGGMRLKVLEALALGKPVVTTTLGAAGFTDLIAEPPLVIAEGANGLAAATVSLLEDGERRRRLGEDGRQFAGRFHSPDAWAARLTEVYEEAREIGGRTRR